MGMYCPTTCRPGPRVRPWRLEVLYRGDWYECLATYKTRRAARASKLAERYCLDRSYYSKPRVVHCSIYWKNIKRKQFRLETRLKSNGNWPTPWYYLSSFEQVENIDKSLAIRNFDFTKSDLRVVDRETGQTTMYLPFPFNNDEPCEIPL